MVDVTIYTRNGCGYCTAAVSLLKKKGVAFVEHNASVEPNARQEMLARANGRTTFPQVFIGKTHVGGCDDLFALEDQRRLDGLLKTGELV
ncbi:glutaredoxin 3 [Phyllobacterium sp. SB3]|uniref:glutaredoxin 3 n=1 Tax=Phyllobacterium sp. SB3 TaxID=3156073 RepID=UPI0032AF6857